MGGILKSDRFDFDGIPTMTDSPKNHRHTPGALSASQVYRDYELAFTEGIGLPLRLQAPALLHVVRHAKKQENPF